MGPLTYGEPLNAGGQHRGVLPARCEGIVELGRLAAGEAGAEFGRQEVLVPARRLASGAGERLLRISRTDVGSAASYGALGPG